MSSEVPRAVPLTCHGHSRPITHLNFSKLVEDKYYLISACKDNNPMLRDGTTGDWIGTFLGHKGACWQSRLSPDGNLAATASADFTAKVWDTTTGECLRTVQHPHIIRCVAFPHEAEPQQLAIGSFDKKLILLDLNIAELAATNGSDVPHTPEPAIASSKGIEIAPGIHEGAIKSVLWTQDGKTLITACDDKHIRWFDVQTRSLASAVKLDGAIGSCELSSSLSTLCVAAGKKAYFFSGTAPGELIQTRTHPADIASIALHETDRKYVTGSNSDTWIKVWNLDDPNDTVVELDTWKGHHGPVWTLAFSPDGKLCASGSEDGTVKLWKFCEGPYGLWR